MGFQPIFCINPNLPCMATIDQIYHESIELYIEEQAFLRSFDLADSPLPSASCLSFSVFRCVAGRAYWRETEERERGWERSQIIRRRESLILYKPFNTLWHAGYSTWLYLNRCVTVAHLSLLSLCYILEKIPNGYPACLGNAWSHLHMCTVCTVLWELCLQYITYKEQYTL